jgi:hypothetical protein
MNCVHPRAPRGDTFVRAAPGSDSAPDSPCMTFSSSAVPDNGLPVTGFV